jgi:hypothetical protein
VLAATLFAKRTPFAVGRRHVYLYDVMFRGERLVENSADPACDLARALIARGIGGIAILIDGKTGTPRLKVNIAKAAMLRTSDESRDGLRFRKHDENPDNSRPAGEDAGRL